MSNALKFQSILIDCAVGFSLCSWLVCHRPLLTDPKVPCRYQKACHWSVTIDSAHFTTHVVISMAVPRKIAWSVWLLATGWTIPVVARFFTPVQTGSGDHPTSCTIGTKLFHGVKRPGRGVIHPTPSSAEVKERVELYLYSLVWVFIACSRVTCTFIKNTAFL
jgi:hypothetical protein